MKKQEQDDWDKFYRWYKKNATIMLARMIYAFLLIIALIEIYAAHN
ncbi:hypothetical protein [Rodentibacter ratti]|nr:hypothetical protein [Rodentibacter ratti]